MGSTFYTALSLTLCFCWANNEMVETVVCFLLNGVRLKPFQSPVKTRLCLHSDILICKTLVLTEWTFLFPRTHIYCQQWLLSFHLCQDKSIVVWAELTSQLWNVENYRSSVCRKPACSTSFNLQLRVHTEPQDLFHISQTLNVLKSFINQEAV